MRDGWRATTIGEIAEVVGGGTPRTTEGAYWGGRVPWITPSEVTRQEGRVITATDRMLTEEGLASIGNRMLPTGTVLLTSRATVGAVARAGVPMAVNQGFAALVTGSSVDPGWLAIWCQAHRSDFERLAGGSTYPEVSKPKVRAVPLDLPPLAEQRRIVDLMERVNVFLHHAGTVGTAALTALDALRRRVDRDAPVTTLSGRARVVMGQSPAGAAVNWTGDGEPLLNGPTEFGQVRPTGVRQWTTDAKRNAGRGDVLVCVRGATAGRMNRADQAYAIGRGLAAVAGNDAAGSDWVWHALNVHVADLLPAAGGTIFPNISGPALRSLQLGWPEAHRLRGAVDLLNSMEQLARSAELVASSAATLRKSLLTDLLSGDHEIPASYDRFLDGAA